MIDILTKTKKYQNLKKKYCTVLKNYENLFFYQTIKKKCNTGCTTVHWKFHNSKPIPDLWKHENYSAKQNFKTACISK